MRPMLRLAALPLLSVGLSNGIAAQQAAARAEAPRCRALLVAIGDYPGKKGASDERELPSDLKGPRNDIDRVATMLRDHFGFGAEDIVTLQDQEATHQKVVAALYELGQQCGPDTQALFWYSGHGSVVPDASGREGNKGIGGDGGKRAFDGSLVCYDSRDDGKHNRDLVDDELYSLLRLIAKRARQTVVVTDSCYSGGVTRGGGSLGLSRFQPASILPWDKAWVRGILPKGVELLDDDAPQREADRLECLHYVHIAACSDAEEARECEFFRGQHFGVLSYHLTAAMSGTRAPGSWRELAEAARAAVSATYSQTVWFEGDLDTPVLGGEFRPTPAGFVARGGKQGRVYVDAGRLHGIGDGTEVGLFDLEGKEVGVAKAQRVLACTADFGFVGTPPAALDGLALAARPRGKPAGRAPLRLRLGAGVAAEALGTVGWATVSEAGEDGEVVQDGGTCSLRDPDGYAARELPADPAARAQELFREHAYRLVREFAAVPGRRPVGLALVPTSADALERHGLPAARTRVQKSGRIEVEAPVLTETDGGALVSLELRNPGKNPTHVTLLSVCEDRSVHVLWPGHDEPDNVIAPGGARRVEVVVGPNARWQPKRPMVDRCLAIATPVHADFRVFCSAATLQDLAATRGGDEPGLPAALDLAMFSGTTRGESAAARLRDREAASDFGVACVDLLLVK